MPRAIDSTNTHSHSVPSTSHSRSSYQQGQAQHAHSHGLSRLLPPPSSPESTIATIHWSWLFARGACYTASCRGSSGGLEGRIAPRRGRGRLAGRCSVSEDGGRVGRIGRMFARGVVEWTISKPWRNFLRSALLHGLSIITNLCAYPWRRLWSSISSPLDIAPDPMLFRSHNRFLVSGMDCAAGYRALKSWTPIRGRNYNDEEYLPDCDVYFYNFFF